MPVLPNEKIFAGPCKPAPRAPGARAGERDHPIGRRDNGVAMAHGGYGICVHIWLSSSRRIVESKILPSMLLHKRAATDAYDA
jgi:hypothetical protein